MRCENCGSPVSVDFSEENVKTISEEEVDGWFRDRGSGYIHSNVIEKMKMIITGEYALAEVRKEILSTRSF